MSLVSKKIKQVARAFGYDVVKHYDRAKDIHDTSRVDDVFLNLWMKHRDKTMVPWEGAYATYAAAKYIAQNKIPGDIVECGVWRGGVSLLIAETLLHYGVSDRTIYMYDTYAGMSEPTEFDVVNATGASAVPRYHARAKEGYVDWCYAPQEEVEGYIAASSYPREHFQIVKGKVEETLPHTQPQHIALLRLDTDWYESTKIELELLFPLLVTRGVFVFDDFGKWGGARKAVLEYLKEHNLNPFLFPESVSGNVLGIKDW